jgi:uncharacterized protein (TIGR04141 family)
MASKNLNIYKLSALVSNFDDVVFPKRYPLFELEAEKTDGDYQYKFFVQRNHRASPQWSSLMEPLLKNEVFNSTSSFLLLVKIQDKNDTPLFFALTGGHSSYGLISKYIEEGFGLKVAERTINPKRIKNLTQTSFTGSDRQVIRAVNMYDPIYDPENQRRILKSLEGRAIDQNLIGLSVSGADSLKVRKDIEFHEIEEYLKELAQIDARDEETTLWPRNFVLIKDGILIETLKGVLVSDFLRLYDKKEFENNSENFSIGYKNFFDFLRCDSFFMKYRDKEKELEELDLEALLSFLRGHDIAFKENMLSEITVAGFENGFELIPETSIEKFLYSEANYNNKTYFFIDGQWFLLHDAYKKSVDSLLDQINILSYLPDYKTSLFPTEQAYNEWVPTQDADFTCLDRNLVDKIEICDLFKKTDKHFVHIKRGWGAKLSHLFAQGMVSATVFDGDPAFRKKCNGKCAEINPIKKHGDYAVVFAIAHPNCSNTDFPRNMTYFSKVNLLDNASKILQAGYRIMLVPIKVIP